jgi:hypothetical protein
MAKERQPFLPKMGKLPKEPPGLEPHQMSPSQFESHPYAVFHSSDVPIHRLLDPERQDTTLPGRETPAIHAGTKQAALERAYQKSYDYMHVFWHKPTQEKLGNILTDDQAQRNVLPNIPYAGSYYKNKVEHPGSLSVVAPAAAYKSQHDYVTEAINQGKIDEVHPLTLKLYNDKNPDNGRSELLQGTRLSRRDRNSTRAPNTWGEFQPFLPGFEGRQTRDAVHLKNDIWGTIPRSSTPEAQDYLEKVKTKGTYEHKTSMGDEESFGASSARQLVTDLGPERHNLRAQMKKDASQKPQEGQ